MLKISKLADYSTVIMRYLADQEDTQALSARDIASAIYVNVPTVSKLLKILAKGKLVIAERGANGGYKLARMPAHINLAEILLVVEGNIAMTECCEAHGEGCDLLATCQVKQHWRTITGAIIQALASVTLADLQLPKLANGFAIQARVTELLLEQ